jgi:urease accessory protein UreE
MRKARITLAIAAIFGGAYALGALHLPAVIDGDQVACGDKKKEEDKKKDDKKSVTQFT